MDAFIKIVEVVALLSASALCIYLIVTLIKVNGLLSMIHSDLTEISKHARPVFANLEVVTEKLKSITINIDEQAGVFRSTLESFRMLAENVLTFETRIEQRIEEPFIRITSLLSGIIGKIISLFGRAQSPQES